MPSLTARTTRHCSFAGGGLSQERARSCPAGGARCESTAWIDVGCTAADAEPDVERAA